MASRAGLSLQSFQRTASRKAAAHFAVSDGRAQDLAAYSGAPAVVVRDDGAGGCPRALTSAANKC